MADVSSCDGKWLPKETLTAPRVRFKRGPHSSKPAASAG